MNVPAILAAVFLLPFLGSIVLFMLPRDTKQKTIGIAASAVSSLSFLCSLYVALVPQVAKVVMIKLPWINALGINLIVFHDGLASVYLLTSTAIATLALCYSVGYFREKAGFNAVNFYSLALMMIAGIIGVGISGNLILFYIFWELMLIPSFALVAYFGKDKARSGAIALKYFIFTHVGAVLMLFSILMLFTQTGTGDILMLRAVLPGMDPLYLKTAVFLMITGLAFKMAIFPLHSWLPETYDNAPLPATILLSAVMMNAPIFAFCRFLFTLFPRAAVEPFMLLMLAAAVISMFYGAFMAMAENNLKRMIAYSSVSQMGYVLFGIGTLSILGVSGSIFHIINHAVIKALLFMCAGAVFYATGTYDLKKLGGLASKLPFIALAGSVGALAIAGVPLFGAFQSEWMIFAGGFTTRYTLLAGLAVLGALFTAAYALRFVAATFFGGRQPGELKQIPVSMTACLGTLSAATLLIGLYPWYFVKLVQAAIKMLGA